MSHGGYRDESRDWACCAEQIVRRSAAGPKQGALSSKGSKSKLYRQTSTQQRECSAGMGANAGAGSGWLGRGESAKTWPRQAAVLQRAAATGQAPLGATASH
ncbi:hypothetical protein ABPG75_006676 [Micractinium tetrahymenae]